MATTWSVVSDDGFPGQMNELVDRMQLGDYIQDARAEAQAKLDAAKQAAKLLIAAECAGLDRSIFRVAINGRSNVGHSPDEPLVYETVGVILYEVAQVPEATTSGPAEPAKAEE